jgi:hypothetical protein
MPRDARDAAYIWVTESAEFIQLHEVAAIAYVPEADPGRFLYEVIFPPDEHGTADARAIATFFGFDDNDDSITRAWVSEFVDEARTLWQSVAGDKPPAGWEC